MFGSNEKDWIGIKKRRLVYRGRFSRRPFERWLNTTKGSKVLAAATSRVRFALFSKERVASRRLWKELEGAGRDVGVAAAVQQEIDGYLQQLGHVVYSDGLPLTTIGLRRLVVVPCVLVCSASYGSLEKHLSQTTGIATLSGGIWLKDFLHLEVLRQIHRAMAAARPSPKQPLPATPTWLSIGFNPHYTWHVPFKGPAWPGHHYLMEVTHEPVTRAIRRAAIEKINALDATLAGLSKTDRDGVLKRASSSELITSYLASA
jgi:hypothetical protein